MHLYDCDISCAIPSFKHQAFKEDIYYIKLTVTLLPPSDKTDQKEIGNQSEERQGSPMAWEPVSYKVTVHRSEYFE